MKEIFINTEDQVNIAFNHYKNGNDKVIIIAHGWYMCKDAIPFKNMSDLFSKNFDVITMDFRGHGRSSGFYTFTAKEPQDLKTVVDFAKQNYSKIGILGFSLGAALCLIHAAEHKDIHCLIAVSAPVDFDKIENHFWRSEAFIPTLQKFIFKEKRNVRPGNIFLNKIKPINIIKEVSPVPTLFLAGEKDPTIYPWHTQKLYEEALDPKEFILFENNFHAEDLFLQSKEKFMNICTDWFIKI